MNLEKAVTDKRSSPAETSLALLDFFQDFSNGGSSKETKFLRLFPHLMERIFGPTMNAISQKEGGDFISSDLDGIEASWLMKAHPWKRAPSSNYNSTNGPSNSTTAFGASNNKPRSEMDPLVQLLKSPTWQSEQRSSDSGNFKAQTNHVVAPSSPQAQIGLFQVLEDFLSSRQLRSARFAFPFVELSPSIQRSMYSTLEKATFGLGTSYSTVYGENENAKRLLELMTCPPVEQKELHHILRPLLQGDTSSHHSRLGYPNISSPFPNSNLVGTGSVGISSMTPRSEMNGSPYQSRHGRLDKFSPTKVGMPLTVEQTKEHLSNARLIMTLWEYYMLLFLRYPAVFSTHQAWIKNRIKSSSSSGFRPTSSSYGHHGEKVYNNLCMNYIKWYFPHIYFTPSSSLEQVDNDLERTEVKSKRQEIFLRLAMEYWFSLVCTSCPTTNLALEDYRRTHGSHTDGFGLDCSYHLANLISIKPPCHRIGKPMMKLGPHSGSIRQSYLLPSKQAQKCIRMLVNHLVCDPQIAYKCRTPKSKESSGVKARMEKMLSVGREDEVTVDRTGWPLPSAHTIIMPSLYNYIRMTLRHAPIYTSSSRRNFFSTLHLWLTWLEPWNVVHRT